MTDQKTVKRRVGRYFVALAIGGFAALSLLWVMQFLIATGQAAITEALDARFVDFVRVKREETVERKEEKPERPPEVDDQPPDLPQQDMDSSDFDSAVAVSAPNPNLNVGLDGELGDFSLAEGDYLPIVKVAPMYPRRAQSRGLEGHCDLQFTVTPLGTTADVAVIECTSSLFERASVQALLKFKYKPRVVNGTAIAVPGLRHRITFQIED
ncbi:MAG: energy transducer TonB [Gammaproteobacteria bacterium]|nr:energy transducer TonB [Gammaproteobacteria bacterium]MYE48812.1 energy transducer TonB [Gammaproteobacteria bacterium]MYF67238.1 energy transducer TonB [Gammaproteobacteria bacterium]MYK36671.1 energy transducer TonB [Gammaproteobacteria bacterium]